MPKPKRRGEVAQTKFYRIDPKAIKVINGRNIRVIGLATEEHIQSLKLSLREQGWLDEQPAIIKYNPNTGDPELIHGECRLTAVRQLLKEGVTIKSIPCVIKPMDFPEEEITIKNLVNNDTQLKLKPVEEAEGYKRLIDSGLSPEEIAKKVGKTISLVKDRLELMSADPSVLEALNKQEIGVGVAQDISKKEKNKNKQRELVKKASTGREGVREVKKDLKKNKPESKIFREGLKALQRCENNYWNEECENKEELEAWNEILELCRSLVETFFGGER